MKLTESNEYDFEKQKTLLIRKMVEGEITEDDFREEISKLKNLLNEKEVSKKEKREMYNDLIDGSLNKPERESYAQYFSDNKKEFRNILGI